MQKDVKQSLNSQRRSDPRTRELPATLRSKIEYLDQGLQLLKAASPFTKVQHAEALVSHTVEFCHCLIEHIEQLEDKHQLVMSMIENIEVQINAAK